MLGSQLGLQFFHDCDTGPGVPCTNTLTYLKHNLFSVFHSVCVVVSTDHKSLPQEKKQNTALQCCAHRGHIVFVSRSQSYDCFFFNLLLVVWWNWVDWWWAEGWCSRCTSRDSGLTHRWGHRPLACPLTRHLMTAHAKGAKAKPKCAHGK